MAYAVPFLRKYLMVDPARFLQWRQADRAEWRERGGALSFTFQTVTHISLWREIQMVKREEIQMKKREIQMSWRWQWRVVMS